MNAREAEQYGGQRLVRPLRLFHRVLEAVARKHVTVDERLCEAASLIDEQGNPPWAGLMLLGVSAAGASGCNTSISVELASLNRTTGGLLTPVRAVLGGTSAPPCERSEQAGHRVRVGATLRDELTIGRAGAGPIA